MNCSASTTFACAFRSSASFAVLLRAASVAAVVAACSK